jgi:choline kinase
MKAVILAAGRGTRIESVTLGTPKCLLNFGGRAILDWQIEALWAAGVSPIGIVVGHNGSQIVDHLARSSGEYLDSLQIIHNPEFATTNNIYSLWQAHRWVGADDFVCLNADVLFHPAILAPVLSWTRPATMVVDPEWRDETMKVVIRDHRVIRMSKGIPQYRSSGTYIGVTAFSHTVTPLLFKEIGAMVAEGRVNEFFNTAVQQLVDRGLDVCPASTHGLPWAEIDDPADLRFALREVYPRLPSPAVLLDREEELEPAIT